MNGYSIWSKLLARFLFGLLAILVSESLIVIKATAQRPLIDWTDPKPISSDTEMADDPTISADSNGTLYAFWGSRPKGQELEPRAIFLAIYSEGEWSEPLDILLSPNGQTVFALRSLVDNSGRLHLFWSTPTQGQGQLGPIYHSWAFANEAGSVDSWQTPTIIASGTYQSDVALDPQGQIHLVYADVISGRGICHISSKDNGINWELPTCPPQFSPIRDDEAEVRPRLAIDSLGNLHIVWVLDDYSSDSRLGYYGRAIYYARSTDGGTSWKDFTIIDEVDGRSNQYSANEDGQPEHPYITVDNDDRVHIVWVANPDMFRYHQFSEDGGINWSRPEVAIPAGGINQMMGLIADNNNDLHFVTCSLDGTLYNMWTSDFGWSSTKVLDTTGNPHNVDLALILGNELHAVWQDYAGDLTNGGQGQIRHAMLLTDAERSQSQPLPIPPKVNSLPTPTSNSTNIPTITPVVLQNFNNDPGETFQANISNPIWPLMIGLIVVVVFVGSIILFFSRRF